MTLWDTYVKLKYHTIVKKQGFARGENIGNRDVNSVPKVIVAVEPCYR